MDRLGHPPCSLLPESSWESFDARTSGSSCPCHGTTGRIASQAGTGHDDPSATGGASTDRVVGGGRSFQRTDCRKIGSYTTDGAQVASTVVGVAGPAACRGRRGVGLGGTESDLRDPGRRTPVRSSVRHQPRADFEIIAIACEDPEAAQRPFSHWTPGEVARESVRRGIIESISTRSVDRFLKGDRS